VGFAIRLGIYGGPLGEPEEEKKGAARQEVKCLESGRKARRVKIIPAYDEARKGVLVGGVTGPEMSDVGRRKIEKKKGEEELTGGEKREQEESLSRLGTPASRVRRKKKKLCVTADQKGSLGRRSLLLSKREGSKDRLNGNQKKLEGGREIVVAFDFHEG